MKYRTLLSGVFALAFLALLGACSSEEESSVQTQSQSEESAVSESLPADRPPPEPPVQSSQESDQAAIVAVEALPSAEDRGSSSGVSSQLPEGPGREEFEKICTQCHALGITLGINRTPADWRAVIVEMRNSGADATNAQATLILNYLVQNFGL